MRHMHNFIISTLQRFILHALKEYAMYTLSIEDLDLNTLKKCIHGQKNSKRCLYKNYFE